MTVKASQQWNHDFSKLARDAGFAFDVRKTKVIINWNDIRVIDIDRVIQERDFATIDEHLYEVLDCQLEKEFDVRILDSGFVKLFRLAQLSVEYLLQCRKHLDTAVPLLKGQIRDMSEEVEHLKRQLRAKEEEIRRLRNKTRKQQRALDYTKNSDMTNLFSRMAMNEGQITLASMEEQTLKAIHKCVHCNKAFLNKFYLHSHLGRRHPNLPYFSGDAIEVNDGNSLNNSPQHNIIQTEKLLQEIKELKDRVNSTEKRMHSKETDSNLTTSNHLEVQNIPQTIDRTSKINIKVTEENMQDKSELDVMEKEMITKTTFEEWKRAEEEKFSSQMEALKEQLAKSVIEMQKETHQTKENEELRRMTEAFKKQESEINTLQDQLTQKANQDLNVLKLHLEAQEKIWQQRLQLSEESHRTALEEVKTNMVQLLNESQTIQQQYKNRIDVLESNAHDQKRQLEEQSSKLKMVEEKREPLQIQNLSSPVRNIAPVESLRRLRGGESHETLPPYNEDSSEDSIIVTKPFHEEQILDNQSMKNQKKKKTNNVEQVIPVNFKVHTPKKVIEEIVEQPCDSVLPHKRPKSSISKNMTSQTSKNEGGKVRNNLKESKKQEKRSTTKEGKNENCKKEKQFKSKSDSDQSVLNSEESETETSDILHSKNTSSPSSGKSYGQNIMRAVKNDLILITDKRLQQLGIPENTRGLSKDAFETNIAAIKHRRQFLAKKHANYNKLRKSLLGAIEEKSNKMLKSKMSPEMSNFEMTKSHTSIYKMGNIFNSVKNKALSLMRSRENLRNERFNKIEKQIIERSRNKSDVIISHSKSHKSPTKIVSQTKNVSSLPILPSSFNVEKKTNVTNVKKNTNTDVSTSESNSSSASDTSDEEMSEKNDGKIIVTTAISHVGSESLETLISSPLRRPGRPQREDEVSIATSTPTKKLNGSSESFGNISNINNQIVTVNNKNANIKRISRSEENIQSMYAGATSTSEDSIVSDNQMDIRKVMSEDNISQSKVQSQKSVLKNTASSSSLSKKKVLFDLDSNQMKSLSASPSVSGAIEVRTKADWEKRASANTDSDTDWDLSNDDLNQTNETVTVHSRSTEDIRLSTKQSPKIAELSKNIGKQLGARTEKPPVGGIDTIYQTVSSSPKKVNVFGGSTSSVASSVYNTANQGSDLQTKTGQPVPKPRNIKSEKKNAESDLELSDWSIDDIINVK